MIKATASSKLCVVKILYLGEGGGLNALFFLISVRVNFFVIALQHSIFNPHLAPIFNS